MATLGNPVWAGLKPAPGIGNGFHAEWRIQPFRPTQEKTLKNRQNRHVDFSPSHSRKIPPKSAKSTCRFTHKSRVTPEITHSKMQSSFPHK